MESIRTMWRRGSVAVAVGAIALPVVAEAAPVTYSTPQTDSGTVNFTPSTGMVGPSETLQFTMGGGGIGSSSDGQVQVDPFGFASKYAAGQVIDASLFTNPQSGGALAFTDDGGSFFVALETSDPSVPDNTYYGYAGIEGAYAPDGYHVIFTLESYAFETSPNTAITIPAATDVPEPSSLSLLALGAAGVTLYRRRRATH